MNDVVCLSSLLRGHHKIARKNYVTFKSQIAILKKVLNLSFCLLKWIDGSNLKKNVVIILFMTFKNCVL